MHRRIIAHLLRAANASPPATGAQEFYALKSRLLEKYGEFIRCEIQEVIHPCWGPPSLGMCIGKECRKCRGTGIYTRRLFSLKLWRFCGYEFFIPNGQLYSVPMGEEVTIRGRVEHARGWLDSGEAVLWLYLLTGEFRLFWRLLHRGGWRCSPVLWPMLRIQKIVATTCMRLHRQKCWCGRKFFTWGSGWQICRKCRKRAEQEQAIWAEIYRIDEDPNDSGETLPALFKKLRQMKTERNQDVPF